MEYMQEELKKMLEDSNESIIKIKVTKGDLKTKWFNISKETLTALYNSLYF